MEVKFYIHESKTFFCGVAFYFHKSKTNFMHKSEIIFMEQYFASMTANCCTSMEETTLS